MMSQLTFFFFFAEICLSDSFPLLLDSLKHSSELRGEVSSFEERERGVILIKQLRTIFGDRERSMRNRRANLAGFRSGKE